MNRTILMLLATAGVMFFAACGGSGGNNTPADKGDGGGKKIEKLIITAIPDDNADKMKDVLGDLAKYLEGKIGIPCEYMHVENYAASVTAFATGKAHLAWFGGVTTVQSDIQSKGKSEVVVCRDIDKRFVTYFIAGKDSGIREVKDLKELADKAKDKKFTFGSKGSTSGHLMPRHYFTTQAGKPPEDVFGKNNIGYSGSHDKTLAAVADGTFTLGALNFASYDKASAELREKAPVIYKTPSYVDYSFCAHQDIGSELIGKIRKALLELDKNSEPGKKILGYFKAEKYVEADMKEWDGIRKVMESGVDIGT